MEYSREKKIRFVMKTKLCQNHWMNTIELNYTRVIFSKELFNCSYVVSIFVYGRNPIRVFKTDHWREHVYLDCELMRIIEYMYQKLSWNYELTPSREKSFGRKFYSGNGGYAATKFENRIEILMTNVYNFIAVRQADV